MDISVMTTAERRPLERAVTEIVRTELGQLAALREELIAEQVSVY